MHRMLTVDNPKNFIFLRCINPGAFNPSIVANVNAPLANVEIEMIVKNADNNNSIQSPKFTNTKIDPKTNKTNEVTDRE